MKIKYYIIAILFLFGAGIYSNNALAQDEEMKKEALEKMKSWSESLSDEQAQDLGFKDKAEIGLSDLGEPYPVYTIEPSDLLQLNDTMSLGRSLKKTGYVIYPVVSQGKNKALLWMYQKDNEWKIARMGSTGIAESLKRNEHSIQEQHKDAGLLNTETLRFVRIYQLYFDFFYVKGAEAEYVMPMQTIEGLKLKGNTLYKVEEVLPILQKELETKMPFKDKEGQAKYY